MTSGAIYYHGARWQVVRTSTHPNARVFTWVRQGGAIPRGASMRLLWATRGGVRRLPQ
jgi:hypothetical protein